MGDNNVWQREDFNENRKNPGPDSQQFAYKIAAQPDSSRKKKTEIIIQTYNHIKIIL